MFKSQNILKKAGSSLGFNHREESLAKMKEIALNRSEEYKAKLREHLAKLNGRKMPSEIRAKKK